MKWWRSQSPVEKALATAFFLMLGTAVLIAVTYYGFVRPWLAL